MGIPTRRPTVVGVHPDTLDLFDRIAAAPETDRQQLLEQLDDEQLAAIHRVAGMVRDEAVKIAATRVKAARVEAARAAEHDPADPGVLADDMRPDEQAIVARYRDTLDTAGVWERLRPLLDDERWPDHNPSYFRVQDAEKALWDAIEGLAATLGDRPSDAARRYLDGQYAAFWDAIEAHLWVVAARYGNLPYRPVPERAAHR